MRVKKLQESDRRGGKEVLSRQGKIFRWTVSILLIIYTSIAIFVTVVTLMDSVKTRSDLLKSFIAIPTSITFEAYKKVLFENDFIVLPDLSAMPHLADYTLRAWTRAAATDLDAQLPQLMPDEDIMCRYHELGGEIVTIGSDAHNTDRVGQYSREACAILKDIFGYVCTFEGRKPIFHQL